jgi:Tol biopolymer transport system component
MKNQPAILTPFLHHLFLLLSLVSLLWNAACRPEKAQSTSEWIKARDALTGREVWQITSHDSASEACYFEAQAFTADDQYMVFSSKRTGEWQFYRCNLETGALKQLTSVPDLSLRYTMHPDGKRIFYIDGAALCAIDVYDQSTDTLIDLGESGLERPQVANSFSADGRYALVNSRSDTGMSIYRADLHSGKMEHVLTWNGRYSHALINPAYPHLVTFVPYPDTQNDMSLPMEQRARTWITNMETGEVKQFLTCPYGFRATHESWSHDGERFFFYKKSVPGWMPVSIASISKEGDDWQEYYTNDTIRLGHGRASNDGKWFISDGQDPGYNPLILLNLETGEPEFLCWADASIREGHSAHAHVHPSFSSSGKFVTYTSDKTGIPQVYVVPL